nr:MAG TPA: hypothetical protein [Caudoviricetes sp.]
MRSFRTDSGVSHRIDLQHRSILQIMIVTTYR